MDVLKKPEAKWLAGGSALTLIAYAVIGFLQQNGMTFTPEQLNQKITSVVKEESKNTRDYIDSRYQAMRTEYVPRTELTLQLNGINAQIEAINDRMTRMDQSNQSGLLKIETKLDYLARRDYYKGRPIPIED